MRHAMSWKRVAKSLQGVSAHGLLFTFTLLLVLKLDHMASFSWWIVFLPLWLFHAVVARGRFSLPAPSVPHDRHWAPCHAVVATPLIVAFELLLCVYLESLSVYDVAPVSLKIVFFPLLAFETTILVDNFRMCRALMPGDEESLTDEAIWETLPHFWVAISMVFFLAATLFTALKLSECFACLVCTKWSNPMIHSSSCTMEHAASSSTVSYLDWNSGLVVFPEEEQMQESLCGLPDIGGHIMKIPLVAFQVLLCMRLEETPSGARYIPLPVLFSPLFLLQGVGVLFSMSRLLEKLVLLLRSDAGQGPYFSFSAKLYESLAFMHHGSRLLGWWSIDEGSREEQAKLLHEGTSGYNTFCSYPPDIVWRLQAALGEQTEITKYTKQEYERLQNEKVLCRICFERDISIVLLPCRHRILCSICSDKCKKCPVCRVSVDDRLAVYDV
ncbi:E3 ubiquitin-protein ligase XIAP [Bienertia sinuspersici]